MTDPIHITVCVVALTQGDYDDLDPTLRPKLTPPYDFATTGQPYAASPDEWQPFAAGLPIRQYLAQANLTASFRSAQLFSNQPGSTILKETYLYIIDPLVLAHTKKRARLAQQIQTAIHVSDKAFCIILPEDLPKPLRAELAQLCATELSDLYNIRANEDFYEWPVEDADRLLAYLKRLARHLSPKPDLGQLAQMKVLFAAMGIRDPNLNGPPSMI